MKDGKPCLMLGPCPRCDGIHRTPLYFRDLETPITRGLTKGRKYTRWGTCPTNGEPILLLKGEPVTEDERNIILCIIPPFDDKGKKIQYEPN